MQEAKGKSGQVSRDQLKNIEVNKTVVRYLILDVTS